MYLNMTYYENICNCLRVIQQDINRKLKSAQLLAADLLKLNVFLPISLTIESSDVRWVGAWWLSWFIAAGVYVLLFVTFLLYGSELPSK